MLPPAWEAPIPIELIAAELPDDPVIVEAGAHIGRDTMRLAHAWPRGHVHAFEPVPAVYAQLRRNVARQQNVTTYPLAAGVADGAATLHISGGASDGSSSLLAPAAHLDVHPDVTFAEEIEVRAVTLDSWATTNRIGRVDFLWLDLQGAELGVLRAAPRVLEGVRAIQSEVSLLETYAGVTTYGPYREWLAEQGFDVSHESLEWEDMGDVLFVRRRPQMRRA
jgi:FkbM family methyltransferase